MTDKQIQDKIKYVQDTLYVISGKWKLPIILSINHGNRKFTDIRNFVPGITNRVLSKELKDLEANYLIQRKVYDSIPVSIEYTITPYCFTLTSVIESMTEWGKQHRKKITGK